MATFKSDGDKYTPKINIIREERGNYNEFWDEGMHPINRRLYTVRGFWDSKTNTLTHSEEGNVILSHGNWSRWSELVTLPNEVIWQKKFSSNGGGMGTTWTLYKA